MIIPKSISLKTHYKLTPIQTDEFIRVVTSVFITYLKIKPEGFNLSKSLHNIYLTPKEFLYGNYIYLFGRSLFLDVRTVSFLATYFALHKVFKDNDRRNSSKVKLLQDLKSLTLEQKYFSLLIINDTLNPSTKEMQ